MTWSLIIMEYCHRGDLGKVIENHKSSETPFQEKILLEWCFELASAMNHMKKLKIIHRDLKPANIFISWLNKLKIGDFGLARCLDRSSEMASTRVGTLLYMAPEILNGQSYNHRADIWSLGCVLYELCTLKRPFQVLLAIASGQYEPLPLNIHPLLAQCVPDLLKVDPLERALGDCIMERISRFQSSTAKQQVEPLALARTSHVRRSRRLQRSEPKQTHSGSGQLGRGQLQNQQDTGLRKRKFEQESTIIVRNVRKHHQEQPTYNPKSWSFGLHGVSGGHQQLHLPTCSKNPTASGAQSQEIRDIWNLEISGEQQSDFCLGAFNASSMKAESIQQPPTPLPRNISNTRCFLRHSGTVDGENEVRYRDRKIFAGEDVDEYEALNLDDTDNEEEDRSDREIFEGEDADEYGDVNHDDTDDEEEDRMDREIFVGEDADEYEGVNLDDTDDEEAEEEEVEEIEEFYTDEEEDDGWYRDGNDNQDDDDSDDERNDGYGGFDYDNYSDSGYSDFN